MTLRRSVFALFETPCCDKQNAHLNHVNSNDLVRHYGNYVGIFTVTTFDLTVLFQTFSDIYVNILSGKINIVNNMVGNCAQHMHVTSY